MLENRTQEIIVENVEPNEWVKLNSNMTTFCRINYLPELLEQFKPSIIDRSLSTIDRLNLQSDLFALVLCGKVSSDCVLKLMLSYQNEDEQIVWESIINSLQKFSKLLAYTDFLENFQAYSKNLLAVIYNKIGIKAVPGESHQAKLLRQYVVSALVSAKDQNVLKEARSQFASHFAKISLIEPDLRPAFYRAVASDCDDKTWKQLFQMYVDTDLHEEKSRILCSLGSSNDVDRIRQLISFSVSVSIRFNLIRTRFLMLKFLRMKFEVKIAKQHSLRLQFKVKLDVILFGIISKQTTMFLERNIHQVL